MIFVVPFCAYCYQHYCIGENGQYVNTIVNLFAFQLPKDKTLNCLDFLPEKRKRKKKNTILVNVVAFLIFATVFNVFLDMK